MTLLEVAAALEKDAEEAERSHEPYDRLLNIARMRGYAGNIRRAVAVMAGAARDFSSAAKCLTEQEESV